METFSIYTRDLRSQEVAKNLVRESHDKAIAYMHEWFKWDGRENAEPVVWAGKYAYTIGDKSVTWMEKD